MMMFEPALVKIAPATRSSSWPTDKGHNAQTIKGIAPEGTAAFQGKNGEDTVVKFDPGRRLPREMPAALRHGYGGDDFRRGPSSEDKAKAVPQVGKAKQAFATLFEKLDASKTASK